MLMEGEYEMPPLEGEEVSISRGLPSWARVAVMIITLSAALAFWVTAWFTLHKVDQLSELLVLTGAVLETAVFIYSLNGFYVYRNEKLPDPAS